MSNHSAQDDEEWPDQTVKKAAPAGDGVPQGELARAAVGRSFVLLMVSFGSLVFMVPPLSGLIAAAAAAVAAVGMLRGMASCFQALRSPRPVKASFMFGVVVASLVNGFLAFWGMGMAFMTTFGFSRGRQLRRFGRILLPEVKPGGAWAGLPMDTTVEPSARAGLAAQWRENGRTEHASVAAFARLTTDLMTLGAPPALVAASNRDALDEIRHTELCFSLARELDGRTESPGPFPAARSARTLLPGRTLALASLAVDSLVDGALHEGVSARVIARLAKVCEEPRIREVLKEIAADEGRHAAHGWDVVEWCVAEGGDAVAAALRGALRAVPREMHGDIPEAAADGSWQRYGIHGRSLEAEEYAKARAEVASRVERLTTREVAVAA